MQPLHFCPQQLGHSTEIHFGIEKLVSICHQISKRGALFVDEPLLSTQGADFQKRLGYELIGVPSGEKYKTRETKQQLEDLLFQKKLGKDSLFVALGGGVTTDLVGFVAATYMRGVPLVLIPSTVLAMVDAAIGGKNGVDTPFGKNTIGTLYLPQAVFIDPHLLKTLPPKEVKNGLSEILKYGLIENPILWEKGKQWEQELLFLIHASIQCKISIISEDFEEKTGRRHVLNFGHTVGHALELLSDFQMSHGEAVALGCMAESYLSHLTGHLDEKTLREILAFYQQIGYRFKPFDQTAFLNAMKLDKKSKGGVPRFVLIDRIGHCVPFEGNYCTAVEEKLLLKMIHWMQHG